VLLVGGTRRSNHASAISAVFGLDVFGAFGGGSDRLLPAYLLPWLFIMVANHGFCDALSMGSIASSKATLDARVAVVCSTAVPRRHSYHLFTFHFCFKGAAYTTVCTGGNDRM